MDWKLCSVASFCSGNDVREGHTVLGIRDHVDLVAETATPCLSSSLPPLFLAVQEASGSLMRFLIGVAVAPNGGRVDGDLSTQVPTANPSGGP